MKSGCKLNSMEISWKVWIESALIAEMREAANMQIY
jgi:hypothetical protein